MEYVGAEEYVGTEVVYIHLKSGHLKSSSKAEFCGFQTMDNNKI